MTHHRRKPRWERIDIMEDYKSCPNKVCPRYKVLVTSDGDSCSTCNAALEPWENDFRTGTFDTPLIDFRTERKPPIGVIQPQPTNKLLPVHAKEDDTFTCDPDIEGCPIAATPVVMIPNQIYNLWVFLTREFDTEWIAWLKAKQRNDGSWEISSNRADMIFPQQDCTGAHVEVVDGEVPPEGVNAAVHSHVGMSAFFSGEDRAHFNHQIEMVVNRKGDIEAMVRMTLECHRFSRKKARIILIDCTKEMEIADTLRGKITESRHTSMFTVDGN